MSTLLGCVIGFLLVLILIELRGLRADLAKGVQCNDPQVALLLAEMRISRSVIAATGAL